MDRESLGERWPEAALLAATAALFYLKGIFSFLSTESFAGRDLASNYAFTWLMQQNLVHGEVFSWTNHWLLGFPSFSLYQPFFFLFTAGLDLATGQVFGLQTWFKAVVFLPVFLTPLLTYYALRGVFGRLEAFFAGFYTLYFLFVYPPVSQTYQVFSTGLVAQGFAFALLVPALGFAMRDSRKHLVLAGTLAGLAALSHPFVGLVGFVFLGFLLVLEREPHYFIPLAAASALFLPWLLNAFRYLPYVETYTFAPAKAGQFLFLLTPLIVLGGYRGRKRQALLGTFTVLLSISLFEVPVVTQELRFYTYALGIGSVLAGFGAFRILEYLRSDYRADAVIAALLVPVIALSLHAGIAQSWEGAGHTELYTALEGMEDGRVVVETANSSIFDSYAVQAGIPVKTGHFAVNDVHVDSSTSANYILALESWVSEGALLNPVCRTCGSGASPSLIDLRMDDLGVRYAVVRTDASRQELQEFMEYRGSYSGFHVFENSEGYELVEPLEHRPVALAGSYEKWKRVNDLLFTRNFTGEVVWETGSAEGNYSGVIRMDGMSAEEVVDELAETGLEPAPGGELNYTVAGRRVEVTASTPVKVKLSWYPGMNSGPGTFNTIIFEEPVEWEWPG